MKSILATTICAIGVLSLAPLATAEDAQPRPAIRLLEVMEYEKNLFEASSAIVEPMMEQFQQLGMPPAALQEIRAAYEEFMLQTFSDPAILTGMAEIYEKHFTPAEIEELIIFYDTPLGRKLVQAEPFITQAGMELGQKAAEKNQETFQLKLMEIMQKHTAEDNPEIDQ